MAELPLVLSMGDLVRLCNLGVPDDARITRDRLRRWLTAKGVIRQPVKGPNGFKHHVFDLSALERAWPDFVAGIRARLTRETAGPDMLRGFDDEDP